MLTKITLTGLPKISLNKWYSGSHWTKRTKIKEEYVYIIKNQFKDVFPKEKYIVTYDFYFKSKPLDASNCVAMIKLIEDIIFEDDKYDLIEIGGISSNKGDERVEIKIIKQ